MDLDTGDRWLAAERVRYFRVSPHGRYVTWFDGETTGRLVVQGGFAEVQPDAVTVLASIAETVDEIDLEAARTTLAEAQEKLKTVDAEEFDLVDSEVRLATARINAAGGGA